MKKTLFLCLLLLSALSQSFSQEVTERVTYNKVFGLDVGYDLPSYKYNFEHIDYSNGLSISAFADFRIYKPFYLGLDYHLIQNSPTSLISDEIMYPQGLSAVSVERSSVFRNYLGLSPKLRVPIFRERMNLTVGASAGLAYVSGGDIVVNSIDPRTSLSDLHLIQTGYKSWSFSHKYLTTLEYYITPQLGITLGAYYIIHNNVHADNQTNLAGLGALNIVYGANDFDVVNDNYSVSSRAAKVIQDEYCGVISSFGITFGANYRLGKSIVEEKINEEITKEFGLPAKLIVTVKDGPSSTVIPGADVVVKNEAGEVVTTGTSNSFGLIEFEMLPGYNYSIEGLVYGIPTSISQIASDEFVPNTIIRKDLYYEDLRFILIGDVVNINTKNLEPDVLVNLTNSNTRAVTQSTSDYSGAFEFRLDKNSSYSLVGIKENRLSDVARASTLGLDRSTTLFVDLELGIENFECNKGTVMDIKYEFDKADILPESQYYLDKLVRYLNAHDIVEVELSAHTDSRGGDDYNMDLSQRRAQSAVNYIMSRGVSSSRIIARGFGETRLLNNCGDGVNCSEEQHGVNRRTEAKLLCN